MAKTIQTLLIGAMLTLSACSAADWGIEPDNGLTERKVHYWRCVSCARDGLAALTDAHTGCEFEFYKAEPLCAAQRSKVTKHCNYLRKPFVAGCMMSHGWRYDGVKTIVE